MRPGTKTEVIRLHLFSSSMSSFNHGNVCLAYPQSVAIGERLYTGMDNLFVQPASRTLIDLFRGACAVKGNVQVAGHVKPAPFSRRDVTLGDVDRSLFHIKI